MKNEDLIVVIEIGSSVVSGLAGYRYPDGKIEVKAYASEPSGEFIQNGVVRNIDKTAQCLTNIVNLLEGQLPTGTSIDQVFVGLCGYTVHSTMGHVARSFEEETRVTSDLIESMAEENQNIQREASDKVVIKVIPQEYEVDSLPTADPVGCNCRKLCGRYLNLEARLSTTENLRTAFDAANIVIADDFVTPLLLANVISSSTERSLGCTIVDIGAGTSTVSIYKGGRLRFISVVPLGDRLITNDLVTLGIAEEEAERIKRDYGLTIDTEDATSYTTEGGNKIPLRSIGLAIRARFQEIVANIEHQVRVSGYADEKLSSGYIFTGGTLALPGAESYLRRQCVFDKIRVATLSPAVIWSVDQMPVSSKQISMCALLAACNDSCCSYEEPQEIDYNVGNFKTGLLFDDFGNSAQEERDRQERERKEKEQRERMVAKERKKREREKRESDGILNRIGKKLVDALLND